MSSRREYDIAFVGLKPGIHEFTYSITDRFFEPYNEQDFHNVSATVKLTLDKKNGFMLLKFEIGGRVEVLCDRCGSPNLPWDLWDEFNIVVKLVENPEEMNGQEDDPDVYYLSRGESHLHVADWIYEFVVLSIPMQKMCAEEMIGQPYCNQEALELLRNLGKGEKKEGEQENNQSNPLWKGLEKFRNLDN
ncbi:YceD family protein [Flavihumibacter petaseus]|uniref:DUF177 domain-containing protein n=1 Tax=Flavihumibacter petaseus NBRC 106054 TaxID=1220578 RepID=A0A0E9N487_9BACT|nr:DUF177 domain-containing protein [Flavihumibacter petaseus]GAO44603.1 hypothetical protein FPE01S_03_06410 [Flavihumibacter petaseus NBRC 106054]